MQEDKFVDTISAKEVKEIINSQKDITLLDVKRNSYESDKTTIKGSIKIDPEKVDEWAGNIDKDKEVVLYCVRGGSVSKTVNEKLKSCGINAKYIEGGYEAYKSYMLSENS